jgi:hypothetical protein
VVLGLTQQQADQADAVINWNATMLQAIWNEVSPPSVASRAMAMVGAAVYDAVDGINPKYTFYAVPGLNGQPARGASAEAAASAAADTVLNSLYPDQQPMFAAEYQATLARVPDGPGKTAGIAWGRTVATAVLAWRSRDGATAVAVYTPAAPGGAPGVYELTPAAGLEPKPPGFLPALAPQWGHVTPWAMTSAAQFLPPPPPALNSAEYATDFNQTKSLGAANSTTRTPDETLYAHFWADVPGQSATPPGHWNEIAEHVSLQNGLGLVDNAHLFGLLNIGMGDAAINCWDAKYIYNFWRPITAIRDPRASKINPATSSDPNWTPLWNTPNFPSYDSGHSTFSGTASVILASIFGPNTHFTVGSDDMPGYTRSFTSFAQAADEAGFSRIVGGIHFEFDNTAGLHAGRALGQYLTQNFLLPRQNHSGRTLGGLGDGNGFPGKGTTMGMGFPAQDAGAKAFQDLLLLNSATLSWSKSAMNGTLDCGVKPQVDASVNGQGQTLQGADGVRPTGRDPGPQTTKGMNARPRSLFRLLTTASDLSAEDPLEFAAGLKPAA